MNILNHFNIHFLLNNLRLFNNNRLLNHIDFRSLNRTVSVNRPFLHLFNRVQFNGHLIKVLGLNTRLTSNRFNLLIHDLEVLRNWHVFGCNS